MVSYTYDESISKEQLTKNINIPENSDKLIESLNTLLYDFNKSFFDLNYKLNIYLSNEKLKSKIKNKTNNTNKINIMDIINEKKIQESRQEQDILLHKTDEIYILESRILEFFDYPYKIFSKYKSFLVSMLDIKYDPPQDEKKISQPNDMKVMLKYLEKNDTSDITHLDNVNNKISDDFLFAAKKLIDSKFITQSNDINSKIFDRFLTNTRKFIDYETSLLYNDNNSKILNKISH